MLGMDYMRVNMSRYPRGPKTSLNVCKMDNDAELKETQRAQVNPVNSKSHS